MGKPDGGSTGLIETDSLFRLPWTASDNAMTWLEATRKCNMQCDACFIANDPKGEKALDQIAHEVQAMLRLRRCDAILIAGGEPLSHPRIVDIVAIVKAAGVKPVLVTNGFGMSRELLHEMRVAGLHGVTFHVDRHQSRRGWIGKSESDLNELRSQFADLLFEEGGLSCAFNTTIFPDTLVEVPAIVAWAAKHPDRVHILTLICVRMADQNSPFEYYVGGRKVDFSKTPYVSAEHYENLTTEQIYSEILGALPDFEFCAFLGGTVDPRSLKWVIGSHVVSARRSYGSLGARSMELIQNGSHAWRGRYLAYAHPNDNRRGRLSLLLGAVDKSIRRAAGRYLAAVWRDPAEMFRGLYVQSISVVQPADVLAGGEMDTCDGCPNKTLWDGRLVPACRLEEYRFFGGPVTIVPPTG